ncbi:hypothetical protein HYO65_gp132 [Tenacibaculum phage PTm1]|uniref:Uncharacterized protein n=2 Tax=Shirahamavirus PTm1 TaxID=2846435 RepID=A0A5S9EQJ9_9CAUD|nr:hypothetical protein HYO65_gp132 [Tenacibaculum phage PTm1]BBI90524.1 hypothetical protein [Tenacibaculum phage PTm1]BBI90832.1 hypothetical protein [Tenacibaculum phage PTm5]
MKQELVNKLKDYIDLTSNIVGFDFYGTLDKTERRINLATYSVEKELTKAYKRFEESQYELTAHHLKLAIQEAGDFRLNAHLGSLEEINQLEELLQTTKDVLYGSLSEVINNTRKSIAKHYYDESQFNITLDELSDKVNISMVSELIDELMSGNLIKTYVIKGSENINADNVQWLNNILVTENLTNTLDSLKLMHTEPNLARIIPILSYNTRIELYSFFSIAVVSENGVVLLSDNTEFDNPHTATASRNPYRRREENFERLSFPYDIIWDKKLGEYQKLPMTNGNNFATWQIPLNTIYWDSMIFMKMLVQCYVNMSKDKTVGNIKHVGTFEQQLNTLSLPPSTKLTDDGHYKKLNSKWSGAEQHIKDIEEYLELFSSEPSGALVEVNTTLVTSTKDYNPNMLVTKQKAHELVEYYSREKKRSEVQNVYDESKKNPSNQRWYSQYSLDIKNWLMDGLRDNLDTILKLVYSGNKVFMELPSTIDTHCNFGGGVPQYTKKYVELTSYSSYADAWLNEDMYWCIYNDEQTAKRSVMFSIKHYWQMMELTNTPNRKDLPKSLAMYKCSNLIPYVGNTILRDTDPLMRLYDPASKAFSNGIDVMFKVSGRSDNKLKKKYFKYDKCIKMLDGTFMNMEEFITKYKIKNEK